MNQEVVEIIEQKRDELKQMEYSRSNISLAIDICLDIRNQVNKLKPENDSELRRFIRNWKLSTDKFQHLTSNEEEFDDTPAYWEDAVKEMVFDVNGLLRHLTKKMKN